MLRTRTSRREGPLDTYVPDPLITRADRDPESDAMHADSVGLALLVVLETLEPAERLAFVLHDVFGMTFDEIAPIVDRSPAAVRQLASHARRRVQDRARMRSATCISSGASSMRTWQPPRRATSRVWSPYSIRISCCGCDSINYFPTTASKACAILFFPDLGAPSVPFDVVDLSDDRACLGRLYFRIPGGIAYGQHWLNVKFQNSLVRVPFRILTADEGKFLGKSYKAIDKQVKEAFKPKKK